MRQIRQRLSPAMVVACVALTVALAQTSYAAVSQLIPRNSVGMVQLKKSSVTSDKVRDFSLRLWDFKHGDVPRGRVGPQGPPGVVGDLKPYEASTTVPGNKPGNGLYATRSVQVRCQSGEHAITGGSGWSTDANEEELMTVYSQPLIENGKAVGWRARGGSDLSTDRVFTAQVLCTKG
jgi:hypothetical protein